MSQSWRSCGRSSLSALLLVLVASPAPAADVAGRLELVQSGSPAPAGEARNAVVSFRPKQPVAVRPAPAPLEIVMTKKEFVPHVLAVTRGSTVRFPNADPILHNVFSVSPENPFDLGLYGEGEGKACTFPNPGLVRVYCNVHHAMVAYVLVLDTPFFVSPDPSGAFTLAGLPEGEGTLEIWHERTTPWSRTIQLPLAAPLEPIQLEVVGRRVPPHANKFGKPYREGTSERTYR